MEMLALLILMLSCYWLVFGCAELAKYLHNHHHRHQH